MADNPSSTLAVGSAAVRRAASSSAAVLALLILGVAIFNVVLEIWRRYGGGSELSIVAWVATIMLTALAFEVIGHAGPMSSKIDASASKRVPAWLGLLIDQRNRISLSRAQLVIWSILVISAIITMGTLNAILLESSQQGDALNLKIPPAVWGLLGLSLTSAIGAPLILTTKPPQDVDRRDPNGQDWRDLFYGDDKANADCVDVGKLQQIFFTVAVVLVYAIAVGRSLFAADFTSPVTFPSLDGGYIGLMVASHAGYLGYKALPHAKLGPPSPPGPNTSPAQNTGQDQNNPPTG